MGPSDGFIDFCSDHIPERLPYKENALLQLYLVNRPIDFPSGSLEE